MSRGSIFGLSAGARRGLVLLWSALLLCSLVLQYAVVAPATALALNKTLFELDGNTTKQTYTDWNTVYNGGGSQFAKLFITDGVNGNGDKYFDGGNSKDTINIPSWAWTTVSQPQDKNDIENAFAAAFRDNGHLVVNFGLDRYASNGDAQVGFWFLQGDFGLTGGPATGGFTGTHKEGDILVQIDFQNGGTDPILRVYKWTGGALVLKSTGGACPADPSSVDLCGIANTSPTNPAWSFTDKFAGAGDIPAGGFVEGGIDLTALGLDDSCFASFIAETRSSQSPTATLSDFAFGSFALCSKPDLQTQVQQDGSSLGDNGAINMGESVTDHAVLTGSGATVTGDVTFYVCGPDGAYQGCATGGTKLNTATLQGGAADSAAFTPKAEGKYCFRAEYTPASGAKYLATDHTNTTSECFRVIPAKIQVVKTADDKTVNAGDQIGFTITLTNTGEGKAYGVTATDTLPAGFTWTVDSANTDAGWTLDKGTLSFSATSMAAGASSKAHITAGTTGEQCGVVKNTADASATNDGTDTSSAQVEILCPDVTVEKTPDNGSVNQSETATFTIVVKNIGDGTAKGVVLSDPLPGGLTWTTTDSGCSIAADTLTCAVGTLASGASKTYTVSADTDLAACSVINNTAQVSATNEPSSKTGNNSDPGDITVKCASIDITKTANPAGPVSAGDPIGFDITVTNNGTGTAFGVAVSDTLPAGVAWTIDPASSGWSIAAGVLSYSATSMAPGASASVHITAPTTAAACGTIDNTATATAEFGGTAKDSASVVVNCPDIHVVKEPVKGTINAGDTAGFTMTVTNDGLGTARSVTLTDTLPTGVTWTIDPANAACSITAGVLSCNFGDLAPGAKASVTISAPTTAAACGTLDNLVTVAATNESANDAKDNTATASITVLCPDVVVVKKADAATVTASETVGFTITVSNAGLGLAKGVTLSDPLPAGVTWVLTPGVTGCAITSGTLNCTLGDLAAGAKVDIHIAGVTTAANCGTLVNTASAVATNEAASATANNTGSDRIVVNCPNITVAKVAVKDPVDAGDPAAFQITVTNAGPGTAKDVTLNDPLVSSITWTTKTAGCSITDHVLTCSFGDMAEGATKVVVVTGETTVDNCGLVKNDVTVAASNEDPSKTGDNHAAASLTVNCSAVAITKTADSPVVNAGEQIGFVIEVKNSGVGAAKNVVISDTLPDNKGLGWSLDTHNSDAGFSISGNTLTYTSASLASGATVTAHITSGTTPATCGTVDNKATLTYTGGSDDDSASVDVLCPDVTVVKVASDKVVSAGDPISFTMTITNNGKGLAKDATLTDTLPGGILWSTDSTACSITSGVLHCSFGDLAAGASRSVTVSGTTSNAVCGVVKNTARVDAANEPVELATDESNTDSAQVQVDCPDVTISKTAVRSPVLVGQDVAFEITATNAGPGTAKGVVVTDTLPAGLAWTVDNTTACSISAGVLTCNVGTLAEGATFAVRVSAPTTAQTVEVCANGSVIDNEAMVSATNESPSAKLPNKDDASIDVLCAEIDLVKTAGSAADGTTLTLDKPGNVVFTYVVTNTGSADLQGIALVDDNATPGDTSDDITVSCPKTALPGTASGASLAERSMTCTATLPIGYGLRKNIAVVTGHPVLSPEASVKASDDAVVNVPEPEITPTPKPTRTPRITPPPTSTLDSESTNGTSGTGLLLVLAAIAGLMLGAGYLVPSRAKARRRSRRG